MNSNFGKYEVPPTLQSLIDLDKHLSESRVSLLGDFYLGLNFYLALEKFRYFNTPSDVITFGNIGSDGIHFGFLTDYGTVKDLEEAPIVCVSPMDFDHPTRIIARNLREFLAINVNDSALFYNIFRNEEAYLAFKEKSMKEEAESPYQLSEEEKSIQDKIIRYLFDELHIHKIDRSYQYVNTIENNLERKIRIQTLDKLGVITPLLEGEEHIPFPIHKDINPDMKLLKDYLSSAPIPSRLALFRDIQNQYVLPDERELMEIVIDAMTDLSLHDEANRLTKDFSM